MSGPNRMTGKLIAAAGAFLASSMIAAPLAAQSSASDYTSATRYDAMGRVTGTIAPDPDGGGSLKHPATRTTYDAAGRPVKVETGELSQWQNESIAPKDWAGFTQHSHFHRHLPHAHAICHVHTTESVAVSSMEEGLIPSSFYASSFAGRIGYHDFEGVTIRAEEGDRLLENLGNKRVLMLRNHGPVVIGATIPEMFTTMWVLQRACEIQVATLGMGRPILVPDDVLEVHQRDLAVMQRDSGNGMFDFGAWMRKIDRIDSSWRE